MHDHLPSTGYLRQSQIIGNPKADPPVLGFIPISHSSLWRGVRTGTFPTPVKLGERTTAWKVEDLRDWMAKRNAVARKVAH
jgi:prophage regulatory protein